MCILITTLGPIGTNTGSTMGRAGLAILNPAMSARSGFEKESVYTTSSKLPFSFISALD
jgi:hypothetical protein